MNAMFRSKIVKIGNSRGIRIPRALLEQAGLTDEVDMMVDGDKLILHPARSARQGWEAQFAMMAEKGDDHLIDETISNEWDEQEWEW